MVDLNEHIEDSEQAARNIHIGDNRGYFAIAASLGYLARSFESIARSLKPEKSPAVPVKDVADVKFLSPDEIADSIFSEMTTAAKEEMLSQCAGAGDVIRYHHGFGSTIRNRFQLWHEENPYTAFNAPPNASGIIDDPRHPDQISHIILMKVWNKCKQEHDRMPQAV